MASSSPDVVDLLRASVRSSLAQTPDDALSALVFLDDAGSTVQDVRSAASVQFPAEGAGSPVVIPKSQPTRVARDRSSSALTDGISTPSSRPIAFLPLDSLIFALSTRNDINSTYIRDATAANLVRLSTLERRGILDWLLGDKESWEGALSVEECDLRDAKGDIAGPSTTPPGTPPPSVLALRSDAPLASASERAAAAAAAPSTLALSSSLKRPYHVSRSDQAFVKRLRSSGTEVVLRDRNHSLRGSRFWEKMADFETARQSVKRAIDAIRGVSGGGAKGGMAPSSRPATSATPAGAQKRRPADPIIVLSNSPTSLINMHNVKALLEDGVFVAPEEARARAGGASAEGIVIVNRKVSSNAVSAPGIGMQGAPGQGAVSGNARTRFVVVDNADSLAKLGGGAAGVDPWDRVVAVFTTGQAWQFRNYKWSEPRELWKNVLGIYVRWSNEPESAAIRDWAIQKLAVDRSKRHTDRQLVAHLWRSIDGYIARKKTFLQGR